VVAVIPSSRLTDASRHHPDPDAGSLSSISEAIRCRRIVAHFQPIASARRLAVVGLEALARYQAPDGHSDTTADWLFQKAAKEGALAELERHCCRNAIQSFARLHPRVHNLALFLNLGSWLTADPDRDLADLRGFVRDAALAPENIAVEILEAQIEDVDLLRHLTRRLRASGFLLVLDDVGKGHSNLDRVAAIKPDVLKIDRSLISRVDRDFHKQETLKSIVGLSRRIGAATVAEGIETREEAMVALELGFDMLQGYFLGRPQSEALLDRSTGDASQAIASLAHRFKDCIVKKIHRQKVQHRLVSAVAKDVVERLATRTQDDFDSALEDVIHIHGDIECLYVLDRSGVQVTNTVMNALMTRRKHGAVFHSSAKGADHSLIDYFYVLLDADLRTFSTGPQVSFASGNVCRTMSIQFRHGPDNDLYVLCMEVPAPDVTYRLR
jgi:EAL domain-containing protein (putative c-di-GMP-specific phosphodiesterase class I)